MIIRCNLSNLLWGFKKTDTATKKLGVNVSFHQCGMKAPSLGEIPLGELNIRQPSQSFSALLIESDRK